LRLQPLERADTSAYDAPTFEVYATVVSNNLHEAILQAISSFTLDRSERPRGNVINSRPAAGHEPTTKSRNGISDSFRGKADV
jgi:hypothetical protein